MACPERGLERLGERAVRGVLRLAGIGVTPGIGERVELPSARSPRFRRVRHRALGERPRYLCSGVGARLLALDNVTTPGNVGLVLRTATVFGLDGVILPRRGVPEVGPLVIKASAGYAFRARILRCSELADGLSDAKMAGFCVYGLSDRGRGSLAEVAPRERSVFVLGNETDGITAPVEPLVDEINALLTHTEQQAEEARMHAGNLAHALKTPLTVVNNAATAHAPDLADTVIREARTMRRHVDHHLARARAVGRRAVGHAQTPVRESAEAVRRAVERLYPDVRFDIDGSKDAKVSIERQDLDEIIGNLIENAAKYGGGSVFVTIDAEPEDKRCVLWIEDDGMGIPEEKRVEIFDRGARLDTGKPGTGLGLAIVRDVAEIYGGSVDLAESEDLGGLLVRLSLPRA